LSKGGKVTEIMVMKKLKNIFFYSWWLNFWIVLLVLVMMWNRPMIRFIGPMALLAFIGYAFYAMLVTRPTLEPFVNPEDVKRTPPFIKVVKDSEEDEKTSLN
jgi:hypothetical protein